MWYVDRLVLLRTGTDYVLPLKTAPERILSGAGVTPSPTSLSLASLFIIFVLTVGIILCLVRLTFVLCV